MSRQTLMIILLLLAFAGCEKAQLSDSDQKRLTLADSLAQVAWSLRRADPAASDSLSLIIDSEVDSITGSEAVKAQLFKNRAATQWIRGNFESAMPLADSSLSMFLQVNDSTQAGNLYNLKGLISWNAGQYEQALLFYGQAERIFQVLGDTDGIMKVWNNTGIILYQTGDYAKAMEYFVKTLPYNEAKGASQALIDNYTNMAIILEVQKDIPKASSYKRKALNLSREISDPRSELQALANLGTLFFNASTYDSAKYYNLLAVPLAEQLGDAYSGSFVLNNLAECAIAEGQLKEAEKYVLRALEMRRAIGDPLGQSVSLRVYGIIQENRGQSEKAITAYKDALKFAEDIHSREQEMNCHEQMADAYKKLKKIDQAFFHLEHYRSLKDSLFSEKQNEKIRELEIKYQSSKNEAKVLEQQLEIQKYELNQEAQRRNILVMGAVGVSFILLLGSLYLGSRRKRAHEQLLSRKEHEMLALKLHNEALQKEQLQQEVAYKNKEITTLALMMASKRAVIEELEEQVKLLKSQPVDEWPGRVASLLRELKIKRTMEKEMEEFDHYVHQVCEGFFERLQQLYPGITPTEKRLAALLRMELSSKEIASIMNISPKSVDMSRYRLRKKMHIETEENLVSSLSRL
jgi:tetratricopeptide (TPR) repeat protein/DNA-binding CsgD family transcriptional regulator